MPIFSRRMVFLCVFLFFITTTAISALADSTGFIDSSTKYSDNATSSMTSPSVPVSGHFVRGKDFDAQKRDQLIKGQTTKDNVLAIYGNPQDKGMYQGVNETWVYFYLEGQANVNAAAKSVSGTERIKKLVILFDQDDVVKNFVYSDSTDPIAINLATQNNIASNSF